VVKTISRFAYDEKIPSIGTEILNYLILIKDIPAGGCTVGAREERVAPGAKPAFRESACGAAPPLDTRSSAICHAFVLSWLCRTAIIGGGTFVPRRLLDYD